MRNEKLNFKVQKRQLKDRRVCYTTRCRWNREFNSIDSNLVLSIVDSVDLSETVNLTTILSDVKKYPF